MDLHCYYDKDSYRQLLNELCSDYCPVNYDCILKDLFVAMHPDKRTLVQLKCMEKFRLEASEKEQRHIDHADAMRRWVDEGYAEAFAHVYSEACHVNELYTQVNDCIARNKQ